MKHESPNFSSFYYKLLTFILICLFIITIPVGIKKFLILISISLITNNVGHILCAYYPLAYFDDISIHAIVFHINNLAVRVVYEFWI